MEEKELTEEQQKFLEECEEKFKDRYTEKDSEFMKIKNINLSTPPIIDFWHTRERRTSYGQFSPNQSWHKRRRHFSNERSRRYN